MLHIVALIRVRARHKLLSTIGPFVKRALLGFYTLLLALFGLVTAKAQVSEVEALGTLEAFFSALSVENYGNGDLNHNHGRLHHF